MEHIIYYEYTYLYNKCVRFYEFEINSNVWDNPVATCRTGNSVSSALECIM